MDRSRQSLLGHEPRDPFAGGGIAQRKPAVDFSDVFGGPPRRFSGIGGAPGACAFGGGGVEKDEEHSRRWSSSVADKPAFAGVGSLAQRRHLGDDFFGDIFRGNESACPTPRRTDRELFVPSTPGSRVLSPSRPLPPASDAFSGVSSLPAHLSNSTRLAQSFDCSSFRYSTPGAAYKYEESIPDVYSVPSSPNVCAPESPSRLTRIKYYLRFDSHGTSRRSSLSHRDPHGDRQSETSASSGDRTDETEKQLKNASAGSKAHSNSGHFHFSIYKWASKGVTLIMPSNFKERTKSGSRLSAVASQVWQPEDLPPDNENMPQGTQSFQNRSEMEDKSLFNDFASAESDNMGSSKEVTEPLPAASDIKSVPCDITDTSANTGTCIKGSTGVSEEEGKPESKNHHHPINDNSAREGNEGITRQPKRKESLVNDCKTVTKGGDGTAKIKWENRENSILGCTKNVSQDRHDTSAILEHNMLPGRDQGKVMDFVKIFNQEAAQKISGTVESQARRPKVKDEVKGRVEAGASAHVAAADQEDNSNYGEASSTPVAVSNITNQSLKKAEQKTSVRSSGAEKMDGSFPEIDGTSVSLSDSTLDSLGASFCNIEEAHFENIEECQVEALSQDWNEVAETDLHQEGFEIKISHTRIQEWSKGKEGNIRSLLSTLQYVLWPGSGWKPVPLVDIIEGASVKRAYQKALLCLHPDKLQQKGAETHQKYIAEKVFNILQEAWNRFNSLSSL